MCIVLEDIWCEEKSPDHCGSASHDCTIFLVINKCVAYCGPEPTTAKGQCVLLSSVLGIGGKTKSDPYREGVTTAMLISLRHSMALSKQHHWYEI